MARDATLVTRDVGPNREILALGPVSRILFHTLRCFGRHFSHGRLATALACGARLRGNAGCGIPVAIGRAAQPPILPCTGRGFSCRRRRRRRGGLLPHLFTLTLPCPILSGKARRYVLCDTVRRRALKRAACARLAAGAASCPAVSGLSSPNFYRARSYPRLGIKELGATTWPQSQRPQPCPGRPPPQVLVGGKLPSRRPPGLNPPNRPTGRIGRRSAAERGGQRRVRESPTPPRSTP